jgi:hypothetical protein
MRKTLLLAKHRKNANFDFVKHPWIGGVEDYIFLASVY